MSDRVSAADYVAGVVRALEGLPHETITRIAAILEAARARGQTVFLLGNGGSAAIASHLACDLSKTAIHPDRPRVRAVALTDNVPLITAWANDTDYNRIFAEQLQNLVRPGDVVIAISGRGRSPNVLEAVRVARAQGATTVALTGFDGGILKDLAEVTLVVPSEHYGQIEDVHSVVAHILTGLLHGGETPAPQAPLRRTGHGS